MPDRRTTRLARGLRKRCASCGERDIWRSFFELRDRCPRCGYAFVREEGYWVGAMIVIFALTELVFAVLFVGGMVVTWPDVPWTGLLIAGLVVNATVPVVFYPWSKSAWIGLDLFFNPPTDGNDRGRGEAGTDG